MDLYIDRDQLSRGLARIQGVIERRSTHPLLSHVLLHAKEGDEGGVLRMTATDTEVAFIGTISANVEKGGELAVDASSLFQAVRALSDKTVRFTVSSGNRLQVRSGKASFRFPGFPAEEYPQLPAFDAAGAAQIKEGDLRRLVEQTSFAVATDDVRFGLNGAYLEQHTGESGELLRMVATDGHRLCSAECPFEGELSITPRTLVPRKALAVMRKLLDRDEETVEVGFGTGAVRLVREGELFWFRLLEGEFPDYGAVMPRDHKYRVMVRRSDLAAAFKRVLIVASERARAVEFTFEASELTLHVWQAERGEVTETLPIELEGEPFKAGFNVRYVAEALSAMKGEMVMMRMMNPVAPCLVTDPESEDALFIVMPMHLD
jgi:DNA polymerase III subunit beta